MKVNATSRQPAPNEPQRSYGLPLLTYAGVGFANLLLFVALLVHGQDGFAATVIAIYFVGVLIHASSLANGEPRFTVIADIDESGDTPVWRYAVLDNRTHQRVSNAEFFYEDRAHAYADQLNAEQKAAEAEA